MVMTSGTPRKSGACSMYMCSEWLWIHSPQYSSRRSAMSSGGNVTPQASSIALQALV